TRFSRDWSSDVCSSDLDIRDDRERAPGAGKSLGKIVACDVLHHTPAGLERLAAPGDGIHAEHMIARCPRLDPARAGEIGTKHAEIGRASCRESGQNSDG